MSVQEEVEKTLRSFVECLSRHERTPVILYEIHNRRRGDVPPATFTQLWKAYCFKSHTERCGPASGTRKKPSMSWISVPASFLEIDQPVDHPPSPAVNLDYGIINCGTFEEICTLVELHGAVLKSASPLDLH